MRRLPPGWGAYPSYCSQISEQVKNIKDPIQLFLEETLKYEPSLGQAAKRATFDIYGGSWSGILG